METQIINRFYYCLILFFWVSISFSQLPENMVTIGAGSYVPLYGTADKKPVYIKSFLLDVYPVTNQEYLEFLKTNSAYRKSKIKRLFANTTYLYEWSGDRHVKRRL
jgi:formylglycine-generating enzyme required for sulfatase activity